MIYLNNTTTTTGRETNDKQTLKETMVIYLLAVLPLVLALLLHYIY